MLILILLCKTGPNAVPQQGLTQLIIFIGAIDLAFTNYAQPEVEQACQVRSSNLSQC